MPPELSHQQLGAMSSHDDRENISINIPTAVCSKDLKSSFDKVRAKPFIREDPPLRGRAAAGARAARSSPQGIDSAPMLSVGSASELSVESRYSVLSRRGCSKLAPSSAELERSYTEKKRRELHEMRVRNERSCYEASHCAGAPKGVSRAQRSLALTVPQEFHLSTSRATTPARSARSDAGSDAGSDAESDSDRGSEWSHSLRTPSAQTCGGPSKSRQWRPQLTVPQGPALSTGLRPRSSSVHRGADADARATSVASWHASLRGGARGSSRSIPPSPSPSRSAASWCSAVSSRPQSRARSRQRRRHERGSLETPSPSRSVASWRSPSSSASDMSLVSDMSRVSRLSRRSCSSKCNVSTQERQQAEIEAKRHEVRERMRRNEKTCHDAIHNPDLKCRQHSARITMPKEFNLSCGSIRARAPRSEAQAETTCGDWSRSLRQSLPPNSAESTGPRSLTLPEAPQLLTSRRARSTSAESRAPSEHRAISRHQLPREQAAIEHHLERVTSARALHEGSQRPAASRKQATPEVDASEWARQGATAEARAQRARALAQARQEQALAAAKERLCVF
mmetsp:Transcript_37930/g.109428  ORF Transcript_37930/g.109428 Transcript_37930/m.109428 type:complete len:568 (-) Transcript_37930:324-2027(-)